MAISQLPSGKNLDDQILAYFQSTSKFEEFANSVLHEGDGAHSLAAESPIVDPSTAVSAGRQFPIQQTRAPHVKATVEREKGLVSKPSTEVRKAGRRLVRPRLERPVEPSVDLDVSGTQGSTITEEGKASSSHELELPNDAQSTRKRLASSVSERKEDPVGQDEAAISLSLPSLKKSKHSEGLQEASSEQQSSHPSSEEPVTLRHSMMPSDTSELQPTPTEDLEIDQAPLTNDEVVTTANIEDDTFLMNEEIEEQQKEPQDGRNQEDEVQYEGDAIIDDSNKPSAAMDFTDENLDENLKSEEVNEMLQAAAESEDEREEGELMQDDDSEQQQEDGVPVEVHNESISVGEEAGDVAVEVPSSEVPVDKNEEVSIPQEIDDASDKNNDINKDQSTLDSAQSPQRSAGANEESSAPLQQSLLAKPRSPSSSTSISTSTSTVVAEAEEPVQTRVINLADSARQRQNSLLRLGRTPAALRGGRGRSPGQRGRTRGTRGGRGQSD